MAADPYGNIRAWVWDLLQETDATLPDVTMGRYIQSAVNRLVDVYPALGSYAALQGTDRAFFEEGVGHLVALRLRPARAKRIKTGEVILQREGDTEKRFAASPLAKHTLEEEWLESARLALGRVSAIKSAIASRASAFTPFAVSGPTRTAKANGAIPSLLSDILRTISEDAADVLEGDPELHV